MITLRQITLDFEPELIEGVLIDKQWFEEQETARTLIQETEDYCRQLREQAQQEITEMTENAKAEHQKRLAEILEEMEVNFLDKTEGLFAEWAEQREQEENEIIDRAKKLVESVFIAMLNQLPDEDKLHAVFKQIQRASDKHTEATLYHHPDQTALLQEWATKNGLSMWTLIPDDTLHPDELILRAPKGELSLSWSGFQKHIISRLV